MTSSRAVASPALPVKQPHKSISRAQIEVVASRSVAIFGLLFGAQTFPVMLGQASELQPAWGTAMAMAMFGSLLVAVAAALVQRFVRTANILVTVVYVAAIIAWPLAVETGSKLSGERPWLWFLCTVATAAAAIAMTPWQATAYLILAPVMYGVLRTMPAGGRAPWDLAALDTVYAIMLGGAVLIIITLLRQAAASVDAAQAAALTRYAHAVRQHATDIERVQVDSIVHDGVLTTLLSAARAYDADAMALAARMARNAIRQLQDAVETTPDDESLVSLAQLADRVSSATAMFSGPFQLRKQGIGAGSIPVQAAEAIYSAAMQAMVNSLQHGGSEDSVLRWVAIRGSDEHGVAVEIGDTGVGFDPTEVPSERLGLRVSIIERVENAGGEVDLDSAPGEGTVLTIRWPARDALDRKAAS